MPFCSEAQNRPEKQTDKEDKIKNYSMKSYFACIAKMKTFDLCEFALILEDTTLSTTKIDKFLLYHFAYNILIK